MVEQQETSDSILSELYLYSAEFISDTIFHSARPYPLNQIKSFRCTVLSYCFILLKHIITYLKACDRGKLT